MIGSHLGLRAAVVCIAAALLGCSRSSDGGGAAAPATMSTRQVVEATISQEAELTATAQSAEAEASLRYMSLRKLEELGSTQTVAIALRLAREATEMAEADARLLRNNAVAVLVRAEAKGSAEATVALARIAEEGALAGLVEALRATGGAR